MLRTTTLATALTLLAGCAGPWMHEHGDPARFKRDAAECNYQAELASANMPVGAGRGIRLAELTNACLQARGYYRQ